jgi:uroporphyrinogen decarboxylase
MVFICDDYAQKGRLMMSPAVFDEFFGSAYKKIADNSHKYGAKALMHSDGLLDESLPTLIKAGFDGVEPLEYEAGNRLDVLKQKYGDKLTLFGNIPASDALCIGNVEDTIRITKKCILDAAEGGGYILGQGANLLGSSKVANVKAMIATVKKYGTYPIQRALLQ